MNANHTNGYHSAHTFLGLHKGNAQTLDRKKIDRTTNPISFAGSRVSWKRAPALRIDSTGHPCVGDNAVAHRERFRAGSAASEVEGCCPDRPRRQEVANRASYQVGSRGRSYDAAADQSSNNAIARARESVIG